jgi:hypothetical protein
MNELSKIASLMGKKGGTANVKNHSPEYFKNLGKIGMAKRWEGHKKDKKIF